MEEGVGEGEAMEGEATLCQRKLGRPGLQKHEKRQAISQDNYTSIQHTCLPVTRQREANTCGIGSRGKQEISPLKKQTKPSGAVGG